jgi:CheY-like chemotaxis protein
MMMEAANALLARLTNGVTRPHESVPLTVLVVDDESQVRHYVHQVLRETGYHTAVASDAAEAMNLASTHGPFDVLVTDLIMPEMNGDELARRLRLNEPDLPVLYITGFSDRLFSERMLLWEGEAFLDKPFTPKGLLEAVSLIRGTGGVRLRESSGASFSSSTTRTLSAIV